MNHEFTDIHIIATNDIQGALFGKNVPNIMKAASYIKMARRMADHLLLVDTGNALTGSLSTYYFSHINNQVRNPLITMMNQMQYDVSGISPHDFKYGMKYFNKAQSLANFPYLSANILHQRTKEPYFNAPIAIKEISGMKIGILGISAVGDTIASDIITIDNSIQAAKRWIRYMRDKENPDFVIAIYNGGLGALSTESYDINNEAAAIIEATEGIDVMITSHQSMMNDKKIDNTLFFQAGHNLSQICHIKLRFQRRTTSYELLDSQSELVDVNVFKEDEGLKDIIYYEEKMFNQWEHDTPEVNKINI